jgi:hypothetical protein
MKKNLPNVTLLGVDGVNIDRLILAAEICKKDFEFGAVKLLTSLPSENPDVVHIPAITSIRDYSYLIIKKLYDYVDTDFVMIIQYDGFILNPEAWQDSFLHYDYIGAPMYEEGKLFVGNGGFCIRSKKLLKLLAEDPIIKLPEHKEHRFAENDDWIISHTLRDYIEEQGCAFAPVDVAHAFSFEANEHYGTQWNGQFGFHGLRWTDISSWFKAHPEYPIVNKLDS